MSNGGCIAANVARLRLDRQLTQEQLAERAGVSRMALGKIERGVVVPRAGTLAALAKALAVPVGELVTRVRPLESVRFRAKAQVHARAADSGSGLEVAGRVRMAGSRAGRLAVVPFPGRVDR